MCDPTAALSLNPKLLTRSLRQDLSAAPRQRPAPRVMPQRDRLPGTNSRPVVDQAATRRSSAPLPQRLLGSENRLLGQ